MNIFVLLSSCIIVVGWPELIMDRKCQSDLIEYTDNDNTSWRARLLNADGVEEAGLTELVGAVGESSAHEPLIGVLKDMISSMVRNSSIQAPIPNIILRSTRYSPNWKMHSLATKISWMI